MFDLFTMESPFSFLLIFIITFLSLIFMALKILNKSKSASSSLPNLPPGPWKLPIIGNMHQLGSLPHHSLRNLAKKYGPIMHLQVGEISNIIVSSADVAKEVMRTHDLSFAQRPFLLSSSILLYNSTDIAFAPHGDYWRQLKKICISELLSTKRVQSFRPIREDEISRMIRNIASSAGSPINLSKMVFSLSLSITSRAAFGRLDKENEDQFMTIIQKVIKEFGGFSISDVFPSRQLLQVITGIRTKLMTLHLEVDWMLEKIIDEHREGIKKMKYGVEAEAADDLVDVLLNLQDHGNPEFSLTRDNIKAVILDMFFAGSESSSTIIDWAMSEMLKNPRVLKKAQAEVRQVLSNKGTTDETCFHMLKYLQLVIKETLRLHPPSPLLIPREAREGVKISGYDIPKKSQVTINAWAIARDPRYWSDAETFFPERFLDSSVDYKGTSFEFVPFGAGRRMCPGIAYGMALVEISLANLLHHFDWQLGNGLRPEDLDMAEVFGGEVRRKNDLYLIPVPHQPLPIN